MRIITLTGLFFIIILNTSYAQSITVKDKATGEVLPGISLYHQDLSASNTTNLQGMADLSAFNPDKPIIFQFLGYEKKKLTLQEIRDMDFVVYLTQKPFEMDDVVISANRWEQNTEEIPVSFATVSAEQVQLQNPQTTADLLGVTGEVFIQKSQLGGGSPMLRGFATNRVLLVVDGVRMNNAIFRGGNLQNVISLDANSIEQTEVIFGPGSVVYGSDAIGGVMSFKTLQTYYSTDGTTQISANGMFRTSTANEERTGHADVRIGLKNWAFVTSVTATDYDAQRMGSNGPDEFLRKQRVVRVNNEDRIVDTDNPKDQIPTGFSQLNIMQKIRYRPNANWDLNLDLHYSTTGDIPRFDRLTERLDNGEFRKAEWFYGPQQWFLNNMHATWFANTKWFDQMKATVAFQDYEESRNDRDFGSSDFRNREENVKIFSSNLDFEKQLTENGTLYYGVESVYNWVDSKATVTNIETNETRRTQTRYPDGSTWQSYAGFINIKFNLSDLWTLTGGGRYNQYLIDAPFSDEFFDFPFDEAENSQGAFTGSIGSVWRPGRAWQINTHISTGFRAPNIDDIGKLFDSEPGSVVVPNPNLEPEYAWNFELGVKKSIANRLTLDVTGFYTILNDAIVRRNFTFNGQDSVVFDGTLSQVQALQNAADAWVWGVQGGIDWEISNPLRFYTRVNFQDGEEEDANGNNNPLRHVAPLFGTAHLTFSPGAKRFKADMYVDYSGKFSFNDLAPSERGKPHLFATDENGNPFSPGWYTLNLKTEYQITGAATISLGLENMTDQLYRTYSSGIAAPGINVVAAIRGSL